MNLYSTENAVINCFVSIDSFFCI